MVLTEAQGDAAVGDMWSAAGRLPYVHDPPAFSPPGIGVYFYPTLHPSNGRTVGPEMKTRGPKVLLLAARVGLPDVAK